MSLFVASFGTFAVVKLNTTAAYPEVYYATLVIGCIAAFTTFIGGLSLSGRFFRLSYLYFAIIVISSIGETVIGALIIVLLQKVVVGSLVVASGVLSLAFLLIGLAIYRFCSMNTNNTISL
ncbi:unnamed protein product [Hymenolepis diminuta]|uniref:Uncharacterized protein n=1 Tax=Hymenolepis diminuta TaxID=6216 RepID=A0A564YD85_HYMDI|nr:unnamed protein product [Hymenolepis diminuta]